MWSSARGDVNASLISDQNADQLSGGDTAGVEARFGGVAHCVSSVFSHCKKAASVVKSK